MIIWFCLVTLAVTVCTAEILRLSRAVPLLAAIGDDDVKIARWPHGSSSPEQDTAEQAAREFLEQKDNGNINKAHHLGETFAHLLWDMAQDIIMDDSGMSQQEIHHRLLLCSYGVNRAIGDLSPNQIVAQTALSRFYAEIEECSNVLHRHVSDTAAFSLYILSGRSNGGSHEIGKIYARLAGFQDDAGKIEEANSLYGGFYARCGEMLKAAAYV